MMHGLYTGATGMRTQAEGMNVVGNNLANVNTIDFKQSMMLYQDLMSQTEPTGSAYVSGISQVGLGARVGDVRVLRSQGALLAGSDTTDFAISGKGFFQVTSGQDTHYTRAGNFRFNKDGQLVDPNGFNLMGHAITGETEGPLAAVTLVKDADGRLSMPAKATGGMTSVFNLGFDKDASSSTANPFFGMLEAWDGTATPPLGDNAAGYTQTMRVYDAAGDTHELTIRFDNATTAGGKRYVEFLVTMPPGEDGGAAAGSAGAGLLMSGTLQFGSSGQLQDIMAFTPSGGDPKDLANWVPATLDASGRPQFNATFAQGGAQTVGLDLGITTTAWNNAPASAAGVGLDPTLLGGATTPKLAATSTTAYKGSSSSTYMKQDGYAEGVLMNLEVATDGIVSGKYSNGQSQSLFRVPIFRFTSEDGLRSEGMNHYSATTESGAAQEGKADTENYGKLMGKSLEQSNVDMAREMVNMIVTQRGFQTNSKVVTTADTMIQKALELKR